MKQLSSITDFLDARISEDEAAAQKAADSPSQAGMHWGRYYREVLGPGAVEVGTTVTSDYAAHIARHDPARVLAECAAKRELVEVWSDEHGGHHVLRALATIYKDHPDYDEKWTP